MTVKLIIRALSYGLMLGCLSSCFCPPHQGCLPIHPRVIATTAAGALVGGAAYGTALGGVAGGAVGGVVGGLLGLHQDSKRTILKELHQQDIQFIHYGDTMTLVIPTDKYYFFNSPRLNEACSAGLESMVRLMQFYPGSAFYVAAFTDNVGSYCHKKLLSQAQAETMLTFLWNHDIPAEALRSEGYADKFPISDNKLIHGSAQNRRIEIQWVSAPVSNTPLQYPMTK